LFPRVLIPGFMHSEWFIHEYLVPRLRLGARYFRDSASVKHGHIRAGHGVPRRSLGTKLSCYSVTEPGGLVRG
jgi:hypothetical protein